MITLASLAIKPIGYLILASGIIGLGFGMWSFFKITGKKVKDIKTRFVYSNIKEGMKTQRNSRMIFLAIFVAAIGLVLFTFGVVEKQMIGLISFLIGAFFAFLASNFAKRIAVLTSKNIVNETRESYASAFRKTFNASIAAGLSNVSLFLIGICVNIFVISILALSNDLINDAFNIFMFFVFGAGFVSALSRLSDNLLNQSGEIAENELIRKRAKITEKSIFNPSSLVKNIGALASKVGGISLDVFDILSISTVSAILLGANMAEVGNKTEMLIYLPLLIVSIGILTSIVAGFFLHSSKSSNSKFAIKLAEIVGTAILAVSTYFVIKLLLPQQWEGVRNTSTDTIVTTYYSMGIIWSALIGILSSLGLGYINDSFSDYKRQAAKEIAGQSANGILGNNLSTIRMSFISTGVPMLIIIAVGLSTYYLANFYGLAIAAVSFVGNIAFYQSYGAFSAIADTSESIAAKSQLQKEAIQNINDLQKEAVMPLSNLRMFLLIALALSTIAMFSTFIGIANLQVIDMAKPLILSSLAFGVLVPIMLSYNIIGAIKRVKKRVVSDTLEQLHENICLEDANSVLLKYENDLSYATEGEQESVFRAKKTIKNKKSIKKATNRSFMEILLPVGIAIVVPLLLGVFGGTEILAALLLGIGLSSVTLAGYSIMKGTLSASSCNAFEKGFVYNGEIIEKASPAYEVAVGNNNSNRVLKNALAPAVLMIIKIAIIVSMLLIPIVNRDVDRTKTIHIERLSYIETQNNIDNMG